MAKYDVRQTAYLNEHIEAGDGILLYGLEGEMVTIQVVEEKDGFWSDQFYIVYVYAGQTGRNIRVSEDQLREGMHP